MRVWDNETRLDDGLSLLRGGIVGGVVVQILSHLLRDWIRDGGMRIAGVD